MEATALILAIAWGIVNLILFFKVWQMCDDVAEIRQTLSEPAQQSTKTALLLGDKAAAAPRIIAKNVDKLITQYNEASSTDVSEASKQAIYDHMDKTISNLNTVFTDLSLGELPAHLKSREAFIAYHEYLKTH